MSTSFVQIGLFLKVNIGVPHWICLELATSLALYGVYTLLVFWEALWPFMDNVPNAIHLGIFWYVFLPNIIPVWLYFPRKYLLSKSYYVSCFRNPISSSWFNSIIWSSLRPHCHAPLKCINKLHPLTNIWTCLTLSLFN